MALNSKQCWDIDVMNFSSHYQVFLNLFTLKYLKYFSNYLQRVDVIYWILRYSRVWFIVLYFMVTIWIGFINGKLNLFLKKPSFLSYFSIYLRSDHLMSWPVLNSIPWEFFTGRYQQLDYNVREKGSRIEYVQKEKYSCCYLSLVWF